MRPRVQSLWPFPRHADKESVSPVRHMRRYLRRRVDVRIRITTDRAGKAPVFGRCNTIGEGGFGAVLTSEPPDSREVWVEFRSPKLTEELKLKAELRNKQGFQYGFQFITPTPRERSLIMQIFAQGLKSA